MTTPDIGDGSLFTPFGRDQHDQGCNSLRRLTPPFSGNVWFYWPHDGPCQHNGQRGR